MEKDISNIIENSSTSKKLIFTGGPGRNKSFSIYSKEELEKAINKSNYK